jgi:hypothetical protein
MAISMSLALNPKILKPYMPICYVCHFKLNKSDRESRIFYDATKGMLQMFHDSPYVAIVV